MSEYPSIQRFRDSLIDCADRLEREALQWGFHRGHREWLERLGDRAGTLLLDAPPATRVPAEEVIDLIVPALRELGARLEEAQDPDGDWRDPRPRIGDHARRVPQHSTATHVGHPMCG